MRRSKTAFLLLGLWLTGAQAQDVPPEWQGRIAEPERPRAAVPATALEYADKRRSGADIDPRTYRAADIALLSAARRGEWVTAAKLLKAGAPANARDVWGDSVLVHAAAAGETEFVRALINAGG